MSATPLIGFQRAHLFERLVVHEARRVLRDVKLALLDVLAELPTAAAMSASCVSRGSGCGHVHDGPQGRCPPSLTSDNVCYSQLGLGSSLSSRIKVDSRIAHVKVSGRDRLIVATNAAEAAFCSMLA